MAGEGKRRVLQGDHNQCPTCATYFNSTFAFDAHRTGEWPYLSNGVWSKHKRRCLSLEEMTAKGMAQNARGWWVSSKMPKYDISQP